MGVSEKLKSSGTKFLIIAGNNDLRYVGISNLKMKHFSKISFCYFESLEDSRRREPSIDFNDVAPKHSRYILYAKHARNPYFEIVFISAHWANVND
jgi:hypothetical protein